MSTSYDLEPRGGLSVSPLGLSAADLPPAEGVEYALFRLKATRTLLVLQESWDWPVGSEIPPPERTLTIAICHDELPPST